MDDIDIALLNAVSCMEMLTNADELLHELSGEDVDQFISEYFNNHDSGIEIEKQEKNATNSCTELSSVF